MAEALSADEIDFRFDTRPSAAELLTLGANWTEDELATIYHHGLTHASAYLDIRNYSSTPTRRAEFLVGIDYDSPVAQAQLLISQILREHPAVLDRPEPLVLVDELGAATVNLRVSYWFDSRTYAPDKTNSALLRLTKNALLEAGIELPDTAREVVFPKACPWFEWAKARSRCPPPRPQPSRRRTRPRRGM